MTTSTIIAILQLTVPAVLLTAPFLYGRKGRRMSLFCINMATRPKCRKVYMLGLSLAVVLFNYSFFALQGATLWQVPGLLLGLVLLRYRLTDPMLHWIHEDRVIQGLVMGLFLLSMVTPELYPLSASTALVMTSAMFYPSRRIIRHAEDYGCAVLYGMTDEEITGLYF